MHMICIARFRNKSGQENNRISGFSVRTSNFWDITLTAGIQSFDTIVIARYILARQKNNLI